MSNHTTLAELQEMTTEEVAKLPVAHLQMLVEDVDILMARAKSLNEKIDTALNLRFSDRAKAARSAEGKDTGRVRFDEGEFEIVADSPRAVMWNQVALSRIAGIIRDEWNENPRDYLTVKYVVAESKFSAWPPTLQKLFEPARTVKAGKPSYEIYFKTRRAA
jgi:hypothetical protein